MKKLLLFLFAVLLVTLFSTCSFLYPLNPWDDANVYMTIGNAMLAGKELYVDIFDHKGPVLFFLHEWAAMLSRSSFVGIYLIEIVCCYFFLLYSLKMMRLFTASTLTIPLTCLLGILTYSSDFFSYGDSVEEFALPLFAHSLYLMLKFVRDREVPSRFQSLVMGLGVALLFWMKRISRIMMPLPSTPPCLFSSPLRSRRSSPMNIPSCRRMMRSRRRI